MTTFRNWTHGAAAILCAAAGLCHALAAQVTGDAPRNDKAQAQIASSHALPPLDGCHLTVTIVEVRYGPGESTPPHSHPCPVIGYVIAGAVRMQLKGQTEATYKAGTSFYEAPNGVHLISANASNKKPAKFVAYFVCDHDTPLSVAPPMAPVSGENP
jgi:quercetin dioxygenase-like cupin family protein